MMAFMTALLRFFVAIGVALFIITGGIAGWFYDTAPALVGGLEIATQPPAGGADSVLMRGVGAIVGLIAGLIAATFTFGVLALLLDMHARLGQISDALNEGGVRFSGPRTADGGRSLDWER